MPQVPSTRWCPTPEQLMILEEMYRNGVRTPNASQIQQITAHLSFYGKIEGKNVFYWFQNHKARDRQKLRRMLSRQQIQQQQLLQSCPQCPLLPPFYTQLLPQFLQQGEGNEEASQGMDLLGKLETGSGSIREEASSSGTSSAGYGNCEWSAATAEPPQSKRRMPKTLELFPTKTTGLKDECSSSRSSSCSASTN